MNLPPQRSVEGEYAQLAHQYDTRWARYIRAGVERILPEIPQTTGLRLLDIGCGTGLLLEAALREDPSRSALGVDLSEPMLRRARERLGGAAGLVRADAGRLPFADAVFGAVASSSSLHYWPEPERALREIVRVLEPGGRLVLVDWCADALGVRLMTWGLKLVRRPLGRVFGARELGGLLRAAGLGAVEVSRFRAGRWGMMAASAARPG